MTRIKRGYIARRHRTKIRLSASSFRGAHSKLTRNSQCFKNRTGHRTGRMKGLSYSYSKLINTLYKRQLLLNRKILAQIAILNRNCLIINYFYKFFLY
ncbi:hypothetical protein K2173_011201 [Erythroxylum novogranatense]|uniref:Large ribosomal subunit protein bL20c n=1 Tax=Erythroxylum novogranatense TaxID=1862640 RepID=A0AAV8U8B0_9ROSI|nr:hypothetical protein K2173_011201 [Erythroxylum novogranatense]